MTHKKNDIPGRPGRTAILICSIYKSKHGGSHYFQALAKILKMDGWRLELMSQDDNREDPIFSGQQQLPGYFTSGFRSWPARVRDLLAVIWKVLFSRPDLLIVQGDLPRLNYLFLQLWVPLMFIRQDSILTCPANDRFLPMSRKACKKPAGLACMMVDRKEGCMGNLSIMKKLGRIVYRLRDNWLIRALKHFIGNSRHILVIHRRPDGLLIHPPGPEAKIEQNVDRCLKTLVFCGRLEKQKGPQEALWILSELPASYRLLMLGDGILLPELQALANQLQLTERVSFLGWVTAEQRDSILASSGVLVMPSLWDEAFGMSGIEAFSAGTPVIAYRVGGVAEWCLPGAGYLVECGDRSAAAAAILNLTLSPKQWLSHSQAAIALAGASYGFNVFREEVLSAVSYCLLKESHKPTLVST